MNRLIYHEISFKNSTINSTNYHKSYCRMVIPKLHNLGTIQSDIIQMMLCIHVKHSPDDAASCCIFMFTSDVSFSCSSVILQAGYSIIYYPGPQHGLSHRQTDTCMSMAYLYSVARICLVSKHGLSYVQHTQYMESQSKHSAQ